MGKVFGFVIGFLGALCGAVSLYTHYVVPAIPAGEYHALLQIVVAVASVFFLGGGVVFVGMICGMLGTLIVVAVTGE